MREYLNYMQKNKKKKSRLEVARHLRVRFLVNCKVEVLKWNCCINGKYMQILLHLKIRKFYNKFKVTLFLDLLSSLRQFVTVLLRSSERRRKSQHLLLWEPLADQLKSTAVTQQRDNVIFMVLKQKEASEYEFKNDAENIWQNRTMEITSGKR